MRIVLDTNVIVSAILTPGGTCVEVMGRVFAKTAQVIVSPAIEEEYAAVLGRAELGLDAVNVARHIEFIRQHGILLPTIDTGIVVPRPTDKKFIECAIAGRADCIVTGNNRHFPASACKGIPIMSPAEFIEAIKGT
ncbi:MAG: putative toxin-antitoxin system toxin component, PIN family [Phycisphaerae bacterium]